MPPAWNSFHAQRTLRIALYPRPEETGLYGSWGKNDGYRIGIRFLTGGEVLNQAELFFIADLVVADSGAIGYTELEQVFLGKLDLIGFVAVLGLFPVFPVFPIFPVSVFKALI